MSNRVLSFLILATLTLAGASSCQKDLTGKQIRISGRTGIDRQQTKTSYSGQTYYENSTLYERIDWVSGDQIKIAMKNNDISSDTQVYQVNNIYSRGRYSLAGLDPVGDAHGAGHGLMWGTGTHDFWAAYPATATFGDHFVSSVIPATQELHYKTKSNGILYFEPDMTTALLVAGLQQAPSDTGISLDFYPAVTTFEFTVGANSDIVITGFEMETESYSDTDPEPSDYILTGDVQASFNPASGMSRTITGSGDGQRITADFSGTAAISTSTSVSFKLFAIPKNIKGIRIIFTLSDDQIRYLDLKTTSPDEFITFNACSLVRISGLLIPGTIWHIYMDGPRVEQWEIHPDIKFGVE